MAGPPPPRDPQASPRLDLNFAVRLTILLASPDLPGIHLPSEGQETPYALVIRVIL